MSGRTKGVGSRPLYSTGEVSGRQSLGLLDKVSSINHRRLNRFEHSTKQRSPSLRVRGTDGQNEIKPPGAHNSRVKTSDRVRGAHEQPATSLTYPNNCLQQFVHHGLRLGPFGSGTRNVINLVDEDHCVFQREQLLEGVVQFVSHHRKPFGPELRRKDLHKRPAQPAGDCFRE